MIINDELDNLKFLYDKNIPILTNKIQDQYDDFNLQLKKYKRKKILIKKIKKLVDNFYDYNKYIDYEYIINFSESKNFIYYFSIFNNFHDICLLILYEDNELNLYENHVFKEKVKYFNEEYDRVLNLTLKKFYHDTLEEKKRIIFYFDKQT